MFHFYHCRKILYIIFSQIVLLNFKFSCVQIFDMMDEAYPSVEFTLANAVVTAFIINDLCCTEYKSRLYNKQISLFKFSKTMCFILCPTMNFIVNGA